MTNDNRRPVGARNWAVIQKSSSWMAHKGVTPNAVSVASCFFAAGAGGCTYMMAQTEATCVWFYAVLAALLILGRALCNLIDGLIAVEGGKVSRSGELFNDIPDRVSDAFIFVGMGYACGAYWFGPDLGWAAAFLAALTAYIRILGRAIGAPSDFRGPMAKTHRMAVAALGILATPIEMILLDSFAHALLLSLAVIAIGSVMTCIRRAWSAYSYLETGLP